MSHTLIRVAIAAALAVAALTGAASASAAEWLTNGTSTGTTFTATAGASQLRVDGSIGVQGLTCTQGHLDGLLTGPTLTGATPAVAHVTPSFGGTCQVVGQTSVVKCSRAPLNAQSYATPTTTYSVTLIHCVMVKTNGACGNATTFTGGGITIAGSVAGTYGNTSQQWTVNTAGQNLAVSWSSTGCLQGTGTGTARGTFSNASGTSLVYFSTGTFRPRISFDNPPPPPAQWHTNGPATFAAASDPARIAVSPVGGPGPQNIICTQPTLNGSLLSSVIGSTAHIATLTPSLSGSCDVAGDPGAVQCVAAALTATTYTGTGGITTGPVSGIHCLVVKTSGGSCGNATTFTGGGITVTGSVTGTYGNTSQQVTLNAAGQTLNASWTGTGCLQGTGTGSATSPFTNTSGTALVYSSTSTFRPRITFTP
jgi:hypothetical protein